METHSVEKAKRSERYLTHISGSVSKYKIMAIMFGGLACAVVLACMILVGYIASKKNHYVIIDKAGVTYTSTDINPEQANLLQKKSFIYQFVRLAYTFDKNNIDYNVNRAIKLADGSFSAYAKKHAQPNDIYQIIKIGSIASVNEKELSENIIIDGKSFKAHFVQVVQGQIGTNVYVVNIQGNIVSITPNGIDNPNGFFIKNYIETYATPQPQ